MVIFAVVSNGVYRVIELIETQIPPPLGQRSVKGEQKFGAYYATEDSPDQCMVDQISFSCLGPGARLCKRRAKVRRAFSRKAVPQKTRLTNAWSIKLR
jgi:hypothetical protein